MMIRIKWVPVFLWVCDLHAIAMPTSATDFNDPAFGPYFELSTRHSLKPTTTIDYDQADFDEFGNDPGIYDVPGSPDTINIDPDTDQAMGYQGATDNDIVPPSLFEPLDTNAQNDVTPVKGSGGISDETKAKLDSTKASTTDNGATKDQDDTQNEASSTLDKNNIASDKQKTSTEDAEKSQPSTKSAGNSASAKSADNVANTEGTNTKDSKSSSKNSPPETSSVTNGETTNLTKNITNTNKQVDGNNEGNSISLGQMDSKKITKEQTSSVNDSKLIVETQTNDINENERSRNRIQVNFNRQRFKSDESSSKDLSSESTSRDSSSQSESGSYETSSTSSGSNESPGESGSDSMSGESHETSSAESTSTEHTISTNGETSSGSAEASSSDILRERLLGDDSSSASKSEDVSGDVDRSSETSASHEHNSGSDEVGSSSTSNESESGSKSSGESVSDESGNDVTRESTSVESGVTSSEESSGSVSADRRDDVTKEMTESGSRETIDNDKDEKGSSSNEFTSDETGNDIDSIGRSSESPGVNSNKDNDTDTSGSKSNASDNSVSDELPDSSRELPSQSTNVDLDKSDEPSSSITNTEGHGGGTSETVPGESNKLVNCFTQNVNNTDCFLLRSLYSICSNQFTSRCMSGVNGLRKTKLSYFTSSSSGSSSYRSYGDSSESADVDDMYSDSLEASDGSSDASSKSLSLETIENLSASYEKANGIFEVIILIKEACPSICALSESANMYKGNGQDRSRVPSQDSSESSDEDDIFELPTSTYTYIDKDDHNAESESAQPTFTSDMSDTAESKSVEIIVDTSYVSSNDDSGHSSDTSNDYSYENNSSSDNTSE